jgi:hypothetical protein
MSVNFSEHIERYILDVLYTMLKGGNGLIITVKEEHIMK